MRLAAEAVDELFKVGLMTVLKSPTIIILIICEKSYRIQQSSVLGPYIFPTV